MPYIRIEPDLYLEHGGVEIFHVYRDGTSEPWGYWFTTNPDTADDSFGHGKGGHFDARMFVGQWSQTPNVQQWEDWWRPRFKAEENAIKALIRSAIDAGRLDKR